MLSSLKFITSTAIGKDELRRIKNIWQNLQDNHDSGEFRLPVDWQGLGLIDYLDIVKNPMDLSTVSKKLKQQQYNTVQQFLDDMQLIWDNCKLYNHNSSWIYDLADKLEKSFKKMARSNFPAISLNGVPTKTATAAATKATQQIKIQQKLKFVDRIKVLRPEQLGTLVSKIQELTPSAVKDSETQKIQIVVDLIDIQSWKKVLSTLENLQETRDNLEKKIKV